MYNLDYNVKVMPTVTILYCFSNKHDKESLDMFSVDQFFSWIFWILVVYICGCNPEYMKCVNCISLYNRLFLLPYIMLAYICFIFMGWKIRLQCKFLLSHFFVRQCLRFVDHATCLSGIGYRHLLPLSIYQILNKKQMSWIRNSFVDFYYSSCPLLVNLFLFCYVITRLLQSEMKMTLR